MFPRKKPSLKKIQIAYVPVVQALPIHVALDNGYFELLKTPVEIVEFHSPNQIIDALILGRINFGALSAAASITAMSENTQQNALKIFAAIGGDENVTNDCLLVRKNSTIKTIVDLKGKRLGVLTGIQFRTIVQHILTHYQLRIDTDVAISELAIPFQMHALSSGYIDALLTIEPVGTIAKNHDIARDLVTSPMVHHIANPWYGSIGIIRTEFSKDYPDFTRSIMNAFSRSFQYIAENPNHAKHSLKTYSPTDKTLLDSIPLPTFKMYTDLLPQDIQSLQTFLNLFSEYHVTPKQVSAQALIYSP